MKIRFSLQKPTNKTSSLRVRFSLKNEDGSPGGRLTEPVDIGPISCAFWKIYFDKAKNRLVMPRASSLTRHHLTDTDIMRWNTQMSIIETDIQGEVARIMNGDFTKRGFSENEKEQLRSFIRSKREKNRDKNEGIIKASIIQLLDEIITDAKSNGYYRDPSNRIGDKRIKAYVGVKNNIMDFCRLRKKPDRLEALNLDWWLAFLGWMKDEKQYKSETITNKAKAVKSAINKSRGRWKIPNDFIEWKVPAIEESEDIDPYLTEEQIDLIMDFVIPAGLEHLQRIKDWLILACLTGQRHGDWSKMANTPVQEKNGTRTLPIKQQKTKSEVPIPITHGMCRVLGEPIQWPSVPTNQEFNRHVKKLCKLIGLDELHENNGKLVPLHELITSHIGRRSFATNNYSKMPLRDLAIFTGHKTVTELEKYIKASQLEVVSQYASVLK